MKTKTGTRYKSYPQAKKPIRELVCIVEDLMNKVLDVENHLDTPRNQMQGHELSPAERASNQRYVARALIEEGERFAIALHQCKTLFATAGLIDGPDR